MSDTSFSTTPLVDPAARCRLTADARRAGIIAAARKVFARSGFHAASTGEIAAAVDCSEPNIYKHFSSKQDLFAAVLEDAGREIGQRAQQAMDGSDDPVASAQAFMASIVDEPLFAEIMRLRTLALPLADQPRIRQALVVAADGQRRWLTIAFESGQARGSVRTDVEAEDLAWLAIGLTLTAALRQSIEGNDGLAAMPALVDALFRVLASSQTRPQTSPKGAR